MNAPHQTKPTPIDPEDMKPERVQSNLANLDLGWRAVAPTQGIEKTSTFATFDEAMDFVATVRQQAQRMDHPFDVNVWRTIHNDFNVRLYIGRPLAVGVNQGDFDLAKAINNQAAGRQA